MPNLDGTPTEEELRQKGAEGPGLRAATGDPAVDAWLRTIQNDSFSRAAGSAEVQKRAMLEAIAAAGTAGKQAFDSAQSSIGQRSAEALALARQQAAAIGAPAELDAQLQSNVTAPSQQRLQALDQSNATLQADLLRAGSGYEQYIGGIQAALPVQKANYEADLALALAKQKAAAAGGGGGGGGGGGKQPKSYLDGLSQSELKNALEGRGAANQQAAYLKALDTAKQAQAARDRLGQQQRSAPANPNRVANENARAREQSSRAGQQRFAEMSRDSAARQANLGAQREAAARGALKLAQEQAAQRSPYGYYGPQAARQVPDAAAALRAITEANAQRTRSNDLGLAAQRQRLQTRMAQPLPTQAPSTPNPTLANQQRFGDLTGDAASRANTLSQQIPSRPLADYARQAGLDAYNAGELTGIGPDAITGLFPPETQAEAQKRALDQYNQALLGGKIAAQQQVFGTADPTQLGYQQALQELLAPQQAQAARLQSQQAADQAAAVIADANASYNGAIATGIDPVTFEQQMLAQYGATIPAEVRSLIDAYYSEYDTRLNAGA